MHQLLWLAQQARLIILKRIGYGTVRKIADKKAILLTITKREGLDIVINLINGKLIVQFKIDAINKNIINAYSVAELPTKRSAKSFI